MDEILYPSLLARGKQEIMRAAQAEGWPVCALNTTEDVFADPQFRARGFFTTLDPVAGSLEYPGLPIRMRGTPGELRRTPTLGEHSSEILARHLGYTPEQLTILRQRGVV